MNNPTSFRSTFRRSTSQSSKLKIIADIAPIVDGFDAQLKTAMKDVIDRMFGDLAADQIKNIIAK